MKLAMLISATALAVVVLQFALADDFKTIDGKEYKDVTVSRVEPDGLIVKTKSGISKVYFTELPKDVQQRFGYDADRAREYAAEQNKGLEEDQNKKVEQMRQSEQETKKKNIEFGKAQDAVQQWKNGQSLQDALMLLQQEKAALEQRIQDRRSQPKYLRSQVGYRTDGVGAAFQPLIPMDEQSGLLTRIATTKSV